MVGLLGNLFVEFFAIAVILVDILPFFISIMKIAANKKIHCLDAALHSAGCVDARADFENDIADGDILVCEFAKTDDASQPKVGIGVQTAQPMVGHHSVLAYNRNDIGCDAHRHKVEERFEFVMVCQAIAHCKPLHKFESHSASAEIGTGVGGIRHLGVQNSHGRGQHLIGHMMVAYYEIHPL